MTYIKIETIIIINFKQREYVKTGTLIIQMDVEKLISENNWRRFCITDLLLNETSGRTEVKLSKHCGKPFIAENIKSEYDTIQCRNRENINKSRQKKNNYIK